MKAKTEFEHAIDLFRQKRYKINSERNIDVDEHNVFLQIKHGRKLLICDCKNDTDFCDESPLCRHKLLFLYLPLLERITKKIDEEIEFYKIKKQISNEEQKKEFEIILDKLRELKKFK